MEECAHLDSERRMMEECAHLDSERRMMEECASRSKICRVDVAEYITAGLKTCVKRRRTQGR